MNIVFPYPENWEELSDYLIDRICRLRIALPFCKGRAIDVKPLVEAEILRLEKKLCSTNLT